MDDQSLIYCVDLRRLRAEEQTGDTASGCCLAKTWARDTGVDSDAVTAGIAVVDYYASNAQGTTKAGDICSITLDLHAQPPG